MKNFLVALALCLAFQFIHAQNQVDYDWDQVKIGGGGYITGISIHPNNTNVAYFRTDVGGVYRWDAIKKKMVQLLNYGSAKKNYYGVAGVALHPTKENIIYLAVDEGNTTETSKILYSENYGTTWTEVAVTNGIKFGANGGRTGKTGFDDRDREGSPITINPQNTDELWVGTREKGLWVLNLTRATKWRKIKSIPDNIIEASIRNVLFHPENANYVYVGYAQYGIYRSTDGGATFIPINNGNDDLKEVADLSFSKNGSKLYVAARNKGIYKLSQPTATKVAWQKLNVPFAGESKGYQTVTASPYNDNLVIASPTVKGGNNLARLQVSKDGGATWTTKSNTTIVSTFKWVSTADAGAYTSQIAFDPENPNKLYISCWFGLWHTDNWDASQVQWRNDRAKGHEEIVTTGLKVFPANTSNNTLVVNSADSPAVVIKNTDRYDNSDIKDLIDDSSLIVKGQDIAICEDYPNNYVISATNLWEPAPNKPSYGSLFYTTNGGGKYIRATGYNKNWGKSLVGTSVKNPKNIVVVHGNQIHYSDDSGTTFKPANAPVLSTVVINNVFMAHDPFAQDLVTNKVFYLYDRSNGHVIRSVNGGKDWTKTENNLPVETDVWSKSSLQAAPGQAGHIWFNHPLEGLWFSRNQGDTWNAIATVKKAKVMALGKAANDGGYPTIYMIGVLEGSSEEALYRSTNQGVAWSKITDASTQYILSNPRYMAADRNEFGKVYVGVSGLGVWQGGEQNNDPDPAFIEITSPTSEEIITPGNDYEVTWNTNMTGNVRVVLFKGGDYVNQIEFPVPNNGSYTWSVPNDLAVADDYQIRVRSIENDAIDSYSEFFTLTNTVPECDLIPNGDFENGNLSRWSLKENGGASGTFSSPYNRAQLTVNSPGTEIWHLRLDHDPITLKGGKTYELNYKAKAWNLRNMSVVIQHVNNNYNVLYQEVISLQTTLNQIPTATFTMPLDGEVLISFRVGTNTKTIILDDITLNEAGCTNTIANLVANTSSNEWLGLSLYPNPVANSIQIDAGERNHDIKSVSIYNPSGVAVKSISLSANHAVLNIDVSSLISGVYVCKVNGSNWQASKLFVVAK